jgi:hypothetical protein
MIERRMPMKKLFQSVITGLIMIVLMVGPYACTKEGPVEKAGKKVDKAIEKAGEQIEKAGEKVNDAVKDIKK